MYQNENLNLAMVAQEMGLTSPQLSELINVEFGLNFYCHQFVKSLSAVVIIDSIESRGGIA